MTTYTSIPNSSLEPGKPIRSIDGLALRDNPIAIAEGDASAPRIQTAAIQDDAITKDKLQSPAAGSAYLICRLQTREIFTDQLYADAGGSRFFASANHLGVTVLVPGVIRCSAEHKTGNGTASFRILKNGVQQSEWTTTSTSYATRTLDVTVDTGDVIIFQQQGNPEVSYSYWRNLLIYSNNPGMAVA